MNVYRVRSVRYNGAYLDGHLWEALYVCENIMEALTLAEPSESHEITEIKCLGTALNVRVPPKEDE